MIRDHHVDLAICSAKGLDTNMGITESNEKDAEMKKAIFNAANTRILAMDHSKFDNISFIKVCDIKDVDIIVTDKNPGAAWEKRITDNGVSLVVYGEKHEDFSN
jgi:DeoR/GlpR family transcriptional regulator of sugar metabolism